MAVFPGHCMGHHSYLVRHSEGASISQLLSCIGMFCFLEVLALTVPTAYAGLLLHAQADDLVCSDVKHICWLQDVRQFYVLRFFLGCAEVCCCCNKHFSEMCLLTCFMILPRLQRPEGSQ